MFIIFDDCCILLGRSVESDYAGMLPLVCVSTFTLQFALICKLSETIFKRLYEAHSKCSNTSVIQ